MTPQVQVEETIKAIPQPIITSLAATVIEVVAGRVISAVDQAVSPQPQLLFQTLDPVTLAHSFQIISSSTSATLASFIFTRLSGVRSAKIAWLSARL